MMLEEKYSKDDSEVLGERAILGLKSYVCTVLFLFFLSVVNYLLIPYVGYRATGFGFLVGVLPIAVGYGLGPSLFFAGFSALVWDYFFIPPQFTLSVQASEDVMMNLTYFVVALVSGFLGSRIRKQEATSRRNALLEESERLHQALLNSVSHELRTPLTTILGTVNHLTEVSLPIEVRSSVSELKSSAERLNQTVTNLLDMSRISAGALLLNRSFIDLPDFIRTCVTRADYLLKNHRVLIKDSHESLYLKGDEKVLETAFANLLSNAARYSPEGTLIQIDIRAQNQAALIEIKNQGTRIPAGDEELIFDKFYSNSGGAGIGLGLVIVREIIELHSGTVTAKTGEGVTTFTVLLPRQELPERLKAELQTL